MLEIQGNLFDQVDADAICITTNGFVSASGANVMGAGCAGEAKKRWPGIEYAVGTVIQGFGNRVLQITFQEEGQVFLQEWKQPPIPRYDVPYHILTFPTKPDRCHRADLLAYYRSRASGREPFPGWMAKSSLDLIHESATQLVRTAERKGWGRVVLPRPGCSLGGLSWDQQVKPVLDGILDDRFQVITFK